MAPFYATVVVVAPVLLALALSVSFGVSSKPSVGEPLSLMALWLTLMVDGSIGSVELVHMC